jgi:hypothetical protein
LIYDLTHGRARSLDQIVISRDNYDLRNVAYLKLKILRNSSPYLERQTLNDLRSKPGSSHRNPIRANWQSGNLITAVGVGHGDPPDTDLAADYRDLNCGHKRTVLIVDLSFDRSRGLCVDGTAETDNN